MYQKTAVQNWLKPSSGVTAEVNADSAIFARSRHHSWPGDTNSRDRSTVPPAFLLRGAKQSECRGRPRRSQYPVRLRQLPVGPAGADGVPVYALFVQDDIRVSRKLTVNLG